LQSLIEQKVINRSLFLHESTDSWFARQNYDLLLHTLSYRLEKGDNPYIHCTTVEFLGKGDIPKLELAYFAPLLNWGITLPQKQI
jgi:hypothetical protein